MKVQTLKGFRDIEGNEALVREKALQIMRDVFRSFGFVPLETPTLEYAEVLEGKYGEEGEKLIYKFKDRGGRWVALRYDQTVPLARYIAQNPPEMGKLAYPFKRYQIQPAFRAEKPQKGRFREFTQVDIDTIGVESTLADAEIAAVVASTMEALGFKDFTILVNDRQVFKDLDPKAVRILDKWEKIGVRGVKKELAGAGFDASAILKEFRNKKPTERVKELFDYLEDFGISKKNYQFDPLLARGLDYYTGPIFELKVGTGNSLGGGGRYDELIGMFSKKSIPATGFAFGFDRLVETLLADRRPEWGEGSCDNRILVTTFSKELEEKSIKLSTRLQGMGINAEVYLDETAKLDKQIKYADKKGIPYVVIIGPNEAEGGKITLKDLKTGNQQTVNLEEVPRLLQNKKMKW